MSARANDDTEGDGVDDDGQDGVGDVFDEGVTVAAGQDLVSDWKLLPHGSLPSHPPQLSPSLEEHKVIAENADENRNGSR